VWAPEQLTPDDDQTREVYAKYGLAMYLAQVIEHGLANFVLYAGTFYGLVTDEAHVDALLDEMFSKTMGGQLREVLSLIEFSGDQIERLHQVREKRNMLAHSFWRERVTLTGSQAGRNQLLAELDAICAEFDTVNTEMDWMTMALLGLQGITPEMVRTAVEEFKAEHQGNETVD
jgi:hypothetical protein